MVLEFRFADITGGCLLVTIALLVRALVTVMMLLLLVGSLRQSIPRTSTASMRNRHRFIWGKHGRIAATQWVGDR